MTQGIVIGGLVERPGILGERELSTLRRVELVGDFHCEEGWTRKDERWEGYLLEDVLSLAGPEIEGGYIRASSGGFSAVVGREEAGERAMVATRHNGEEITPERGGPWRLVVLGGPCYRSVKNLERVELLAEAPRETAKEIALGRISGGER